MLYETKSANTLKASAVHGPPSTTRPAFRFFVWSAVTGGFQMAAPAAGGAVDGVSGAPLGGFIPGAGEVGEAILRLPGQPVLVEASAAISAGANVETLADGRAVTRTTGIILGRALTAAAGAGSKFWLAFA